MESRNGMLRYNVIPDSTARPPAFKSDVFYLEGQDSVKITVPPGFEQEITALTWRLGEENLIATFHKSGNDIFLACPTGTGAKKHVWLEIKAADNKIFWIDFFTEQ
jgi:hypothetical protein